MSKIKLISSYSKDGWMGKNTLVVSLWPFIAQRVLIFYENGVEELNTETCVKSEVITIKSSI